MRSTPNSTLIHYLKTFQSLLYVGNILLTVRSLTHRKAYARAIEVQPLVNIEIRRTVKISERSESDCGL